MSRTLDLLNAVAGRLRALETPAGDTAFADVRVELDRYDLGDLLKDSTKTPAARVCFMRAAPARRPTGELDRDVSLGVVVISRREGRPSPEVSSADARCLDLMEAVSGMLTGDPYVGLGSLSAADVGDELVVVSDAVSGKGMAIGLVEAKWRLYGASAPPPAFAVAAGLTPDPRPISVTSGDDTIAGDGAPDDGGAP